MSRIYEISKRSKETILSAVSKAKQKDFTKSVQTSKSTDPVGHIIIKNEDKVAEIKAKMADNKYVVEEASFDTLSDKINEIVAKYGFKSFIYPSNLNVNVDLIKAEKKVCFDKSIEELRSEVFHSDFSVIQARAGVSSHGVALVLSSKEQPRMLSLAPKLCIILLDKKNIVKSISEALNLAKSENAALPSNILFIAGPSRTADIELITVFGVHGPQIVHVILY